MRRLFFVAVLTLALSGCSGLSTAVVPAEEPSVRYDAPDTSHVEELPPVELDGEASMPLDVTVYSDTSSRPTTDVEAVTVDRSDPDQQTVTVRSRSGSQTTETTFALPAVGERTVLYSDSSGALSGSVFGAPISHETKVITSTIDRPWWQDLGRRIQIAVVFVIALALGGLAVKVTPL
jgi:hypothetical protein